MLQLETNLIEAFAMNSSNIYITFLPMNRTFIETMKE